MERLKQILIKYYLFKNDVTILGITLDNLFTTPDSEQRYDVGIIINGNENYDELSVRYIDSGSYAIFEVSHTEKAIAYFWNNIEQFITDLPIDCTKPIIERYHFSKISSHLCEFCIPLKDICQ